MGFPVLDTTVFSRVLYQLSYLAAGRSVLPCPRRGDAELVVREQAVGDQTDAEDDRHDRRRGVLREHEDPRCGDQRCADDVVERRMELRRDEAPCHCFVVVALIRTACGLGSATERSKRVSGVRAGCGEPLEETVDELVLQEHVICACVLRRTVQRRGVVSGERDQAEARVVAPDPRAGADAVEQGHMEVEHRSIGRQFVDELDRGEAVRRRPDHGELVLVLDQRAEMLQECLVVVGEQDPDRALGSLSDHRS